MTSMTLRQAVGRAWLYQLCRDCGVYRYGLGVGQTRRCL